MFLNAASEDPDKTGRMPRLILVFAGRICHFVGFCYEVAQIIMPTDHTSFFQS